MRYFFESLAGRVFLAVLNSMRAATRCRNSITRLNNLKLFLDVTVCVLVLVDNERTHVLCTKRPLVTATVS